MGEFIPKIQIDVEKSGSSVVRMRGSEKSKNFSKNLRRDLCEVGYRKEIFPSRFVCIWSQLLYLLCEFSDHVGKPGAFSRRDPFQSEPFILDAKIL